MIDVNQFRLNIVRPTLKLIGLHSQAAENLLVGTALKESGLHYIKQLGGGPALGVYQIEPNTHDDIFFRYLSTINHNLYEKINPLRGSRDNWELDLIGNLPYATAIARTKFWMDPEPLPEDDDIVGLAGIWKRVYNTSGGAGHASEWVKIYRKHN